MENLESLYDVAIIGLAGRFPGAQDPEQFWQNISQGVENITFFSNQELLEAGVDPDLLNRPDYVKAKAIVADIDCFDARFFGVNPREAELMDPQQRVFLECAWHALENAGYDPEQYTGRIGVYAGAATNAYQLNSLYSQRDQLGTAAAYQATISNDKDFLATHVAYKLNLKGASVTVQTACSTSLVAVHWAGQSLINRECDMVLAGGVSLEAPQIAGYIYEPGAIASPDGRCRPFDAAAQGTVGGNGVGIVVLKRLADALEDRDTIHAIIKGSAINNDGARKIGYTAPSEDGQVEVIAWALALANVNPETITYVETHGTGTALGDPVEVAALTRAFRAYTQAQGFCAIGSVKSNIGHLNAAAGIAGLIKTVLALRHEQLPPSLHFTEPNPKLDLANSPFYVNTELQDWPTKGPPRRAGVSSFGIGGTNAHVVLEEAPPLPSTKPERGEHLLVLSAQTEEALAKVTANLAAYLRQRPQANLADVAYTLQVGRRPFAHRRILVCHDTDDAATALETLDPKRILTAFEEPRHRPLFYMFPGQGTQYVNMGRGLYQSQPLFRATMDRCAAWLTPHLGFNLLDTLYPDAEGEAAATERLNQTAITQPALFAIEYALAKQWQAWGLRPHAMIGHSIGEYVAACLAGVFTLEDALELVAHRGQLIQQLPGGSMLGVPLSETKVGPYLDDRLSLAAVNSPQFCTLSGPDQAIDALQTRLGAKGIQYRRLHTSHAFHSTMMEPILDEFAARVERLTLNAPAIPFVSNVTGDWIAADEATDPRYWARHLQQTVRFAAGLQTLLAEEDQILLEVGPGRTLGTLARQQKAQTVFTSLPHPRDQRTDRPFMLTTLGQLWLSGLKIDWPGLYGDEPRRRVPLPPYPFARERYWLEPTRRTSENKIETRWQPLDKKPDIADWFYVPVWKQSILSEPGRLAGRKLCWLLFLDTQGLGARIAKRLERAEQRVVTVQAGEKFRRTGDSAYTIDPQRQNDYTRLLEELAARDTTPQRIVHLWSVTPTHTAQSELEFYQETQNLGFYSLFFLAQALGNQNLTQQCQLTAITNNVHQVIGEEALHPAKATLLGAVKVIPQEYPNLSCRSLDVVLPQPGSKQEEKLVEQLLTELSTPSPEAVIAYRGNHRWVQTFEPVQLAPPLEQPTRLRHKGVYLITGGLGGIGLTLAKYLAQSVQARLILVGRSTLPPRDQWQRLTTAPHRDDVAEKLQKVQELEALPAKVLIISADVADREQMQKAIATAEKQFGPINGVIHCAGVADYAGVIHNRTPETTESVLAPKVKGTLVLAHLLRDARLDFFILCSSMSAILYKATFGQISYCAANDFLDAFACRQAAQDKTFTVSINWDNWQKVGMSVEASKQWAGAYPAPSGLFELAAGLLPSEGIEAFRRILETSLPRIAVSTRDLTTLIERHRDYEIAALTEYTPAPPTHARPQLRNPYVAPGNEVERTIADVWQKLLGVDRVGIHDDFFELGGHSLLLTRLRNDLAATLHAELSMRSLFENATVAGMAQLATQSPPQAVEEDTPIAQQLQSAFPTERPQRLERYLRRQIAQSLDIQPDQLPQDGNLTALDLNLVAQVELMQKFKRDLNLYYYPIEIVAHATTSDLAHSILAELDRMADLPRLATRHPLSAYKLKPSGQDTASETLSSPPTSKNKSMVFLHSSPRAGSTLLRVMLAGHPDVFCPPEINLLPYENMQQWQRHTGYSPKFRWPAQGLHSALTELFDLTFEESWALLDDLVARNEPIQSVYAQLQNRAGQRLLVDKSPTYWRDGQILRRSEALFQDARYILLVRHPYAVVESILRTRLDRQPGLRLFKDDDVDPYVAAETIWALSSRNLLHFVESIEPERYHLLRFEDLVSQPAGVMADLCRFLGIPFDQARLLNPYDGRRERMIQGLGDPNILQHNHIDPALGTIWQKIKLPRPLDASTQRLAARLGYELPENVEPPPPHDPLEAQRIASLDELSDEQVAAQLSKLLAEEQTTATRRD